MSGKRCTSPASASGPSLASSHTPSVPVPTRERSSSRRASQSASGTMTSPRTGTSGNSPLGPRSSRCQLSATMRRSLISVAIYGFLEGFDADAVHHVDEALGVAVAPREIALDQLFDHVGDLGASERWADDLAEGCAPSGPDFTLIAPDLDLVPLLAALVDAEYADVADVMVATGVHAAGDIEVDLADIVQVVEIVEALLKCLGHRDRLGVGERTEVPARAADDVGEQADIGRGESQFPYLLPQGVQVGQLHVGKDQVLLVGYAQLAERIAVGEVCDFFHLLDGDIARRHSGLLQGQRHRGITRFLVRMDVALVPVRERPLGRKRSLEPGIGRRQPQVARARKPAFDADDLLGDERRGAVLQMRPFSIDFLAEFLGAALFHQDLDARLVDVVAPSIAVVNPQDGLDVSEQMPPRQKFADDEPDRRSAAKASSDQHAEPHLALLVPEGVQSDVVHGDRRAIGLCAVHGELELARKIRELGMERGPLADDLAPHEGIDDLVLRDAGEMIGGDIAEGIARGLDRVHLHRRQLREYVGNALELGPVQLQVLARAEVAVAAVVLVGDVREFSQLLRRQEAVGNRDAQHRRVALDVETVPEAQRAELVIRELAREKTFRLVAELDNALVDELLVDFVVKVHGFYSASLPPMRISIAASAPRSKRSGIFWLSALPSQMPGREPTSRAPSSFQSTAPAAACPRPATSVSGTAWAMSVPTMRATARLG